MQLAAEKDLKKDGYLTPVWNKQVFKELFKTSLNQLPLCLFVALRNQH